MSHDAGKQPAHSAVGMSAGPSSVPHFEADADAETEIYVPREKAKNKFASALRKAMFQYVADARSHGDTLSLWEQQGVRQVAAVQVEKLIQALETSDGMVKFAKAKEAYLSVQKLVHLDKATFARYADLPAQRLQVILEGCAEAEAVQANWPLAVAYFDLSVRPGPAIVDTGGGSMQATVSKEPIQNPKPKYHKFGRRADRDRRENF